MHRTTPLLLLTLASTAFAVPGASPAPKKHTDVLLPLNAAVPAELVPFKPGSTTEKLPAKLEAALHVGPLSRI